MMRQEGARLDRAGSAGHGKKLGFSCRRDASEGF